ncbi:MAG: hypothetical protein HYS04_01185 [Acidobacteria bacterium]|nr:hypothetical protein [Acidobacteriota bacterium]
MADSFDWNLDGSGYGQPNASSCWYAAYAILYRWNQKPTNAIRERIAKAGLDFSDYYKYGLPTDDFPKTRAALGLVGWRGQYAVTLAGDLESLLYMLKGYGPLWCAFSRPGAHVVVITGVDSRANTIHILNPWSYNGFDADSQHLTPAMFQNRLNNKSYSVIQAFM